MNKSIKFFTFLTIVLGLFFLLTAPNINRTVKAGRACCVPGSCPNCICDYCRDGGVCSYPGDLCQPGEEICPADKPASVPCGEDECKSNGNVTCGPCSAACGDSGTQTCSDNCGSWDHACNRFPCCLDTKPAKFNLQSPQNEEKIESITPSLVWQAPTGWGTVCNSNLRNNRYLVYVTVNPTGGATCPAPDRSNTAVWEHVYTGAYTNYSLTDAQKRLWNQYYCWFVYAHNGVLDRYSNQTWSFFTKIPDPYFSTYGGDAYIAGGVPGVITTAPNQTEFTIGLTSPGSRLGVIRDELNGTTPYFSTNLFFAGGGINSRASHYNFTVTGEDTNYQQYTRKTSYETAELSHSFYEYYRERVTNRFQYKGIQSSSIINTASGKAVPTNGIYSVRSALGINVDPANKTIASISITNTDKFIWPMTTNISPQTGWPGYDNPNVVDLSTYNDWGASVGPEALSCDGQSMFFIDGDLTISADIINATPDSSCVFFVKGHLNIQLPDKRTAHNDYRRIDGLFIANSLSVRGKDDQGAVIVNGGVITHNSGASIDPNYFANNKHDVITYTPFRPQTFYVYDPRHIMIWKNELAGELDSPPIREQRYLDLLGD